MSICQKKQFDVHLNLVVKCCTIKNDQSKNIIKTTIWVIQLRYMRFHVNQFLIVISKYCRLV